jgi:hypothetical protein
MDIQKPIDKIMNQLARHRERYVRAYIVATGFDPRDCVLVEQRDGFTITVGVVARENAGLHEAFNTAKMPKLPKLPTAGVPNGVFSIRG